MSAFRDSKPRGWYKRKRLAWNDGYEILLRVEAALWRVQARDASVQTILDHCRRDVLVEMGYVVEERPTVAAESKDSTHSRAW